MNPGVLASAVLHLSIGLLLWTGLSFEATPAPPENIEVKLVPPLPAPEPAKASQPKPAPPPAGGSPAFSAATAKVEQKTAEKELPPVTSPEATPEPDNAESKPEPEEATEPHKPIDAKKPVSPDSTIPAPEEKPQPEPEKAAESAKPRASEKLSSLAPARQLFSEESLSSFRVRQSARKMTARDRIKQLCTIEALEQVRRQRPGSFPDLIVPYSRSGEGISDYGLNASGGAFRSRGDWYNINFKCTVDNSRSRVVSFSFAVGGSVPRSEWGGRGLLID
ncbi:DUF930 domain-containing protein [Phyllobacterium sp. SB3]|uniref:DUF930 domain-containing protein n=1 Tax=Phyllobacterium sp. SB3 TaxID=3156073 RepID=UPI0032AF08F6